VLGCDMKPINMRDHFKMDVWHGPRPLGKHNRVSTEVRRIVGRHTSIALFVAVVRPVLRPICRELLTLT